MSIRESLERRRRERKKHRDTVDQIAAIIDMASLDVAIRGGPEPRTPHELKPDRVFDTCVEVAAGDRRAILDALADRRFNPMREAFREQKRRPSDDILVAQGRYLLDFGALNYQRR